MSGAPPFGPQSRVTLANWQDPPFNRWAFQHVRELIPTARIPRATGPVWRLAADHRDIAGIRFRSEDRELSIADLLAETWTDGFLVLHQGRIVTEQYFNGLAPDVPHLLMSVSKSITSTVAGVLAGRGLLDATALVTDIVPELHETSFEGATVQHLLDMRAGTRFDEDYDNPKADVRTYERVYLWRPDDGQARPEDALSYFGTLRNDAPHGGPFRYRSILPDVLAWVLERGSVQFGHDIGDEGGGVEECVAGQHARHGGGDRFGHRHQQVRDIWCQAVEVLLGHDPAPVQDQEAVGVGFGKQFRDAQFTVFVAERQPRDIAFLCHQSPSRATATPDARGGDQFPHVLERPSVEWRILPVRERHL